MSDSARASGQTRMQAAGTVTAVVAVIYGLAVAFISGSIAVWGAFVVAGVAVLSWFWARMGR